MEWLWAVLLVISMMGCACVVAFSLSAENLECRTVTGAVLTIIQVLAENM